MAQDSKKDLHGDLLPVTLLCGFLGAGKTTLLKHILESKHSEDDFKCAVIVNDMASLNIDKSLIDQSALVQSDEVIAMQNGCFCCTLQSDLADQIIKLAEKKIFNYIIIEASGVSEPAHIAPLFELCDDPHDHDVEHENSVQLGEVAQIDTCVTVIDAAEFHSNLDSIKVYEEGDAKGTISELLVEQVGFANVIVLNKQDLVTEAQQQEIINKISLLNPKAKILTTFQSKLNVIDILKTGFFQSTQSMLENSVIITASRNGEEYADTDCCKTSLDDGGQKCCKRPESDTFRDSGRSQVTIGAPVAALTRHESRFGITSFVYRSRLPFHPGRLFDQILDPFFVMKYQEDPDPCNCCPMSYVCLEALQNRAAQKQAKRLQAIGELLRSKGFVWLANAHSNMISWQQAGNIVKLNLEGSWLCQDRGLWEGTPLEERVRKDMRGENGKELLYGDRRQELVFIGVGLDHSAMQGALDNCLLTEEEMHLGPEVWESTFKFEDKIKLRSEEEISTGYRVEITELSDDSDN